VVGLSGFKLNHALLTYVAEEPPARQRRQSGRRREHRVSKRLQAEAITRLVAEYVAGTTAAELDQRYGLARSTVLRLVRAAGERARQQRFNESETREVVRLFESGLSQTDVARLISRSPSAVWHCLPCRTSRSKQMTSSANGPGSAKSALPN
jgi:hypothetical protein